MQRNGGRIRSIRECNLVDKLLGILKKSVSSETMQTLLKVIHALLCTNPRVTDVLCFALFTAATLDPAANSEKDLELDEFGTDGKCQYEEGDRASVVVLRNRCLKLFLSLLYCGPNIHTKYCEDVVQVVGFDWILLFVGQGHLHPSTVVWGLKILVTIVSIPSLMDKFRQGTCNGHWLMKSEIVLQNKMIQALGQTTSSSTRAAKRTVRQDIFSVPGFQSLNWLLPNHVEIPEIYFLLISMVLGKPVKEVPLGTKFDLDTCCRFILGTASTDSNISIVLNKVKLSGDAITSIMVMVRFSKKQRLNLIH